MEYKVETKILEQSLRVKSLWVLYCCPTFKSEHQSQTPIHLYIRVKCALKFKKKTPISFFRFLFLCQLCCDEMVDIDILSLLYELSDLSFVHCMNSKAVNVCPLYIPIIILHVTVSYSH